uniref:Uncharacterized protein n=1 Tax=Tanacetum cinerariifolium TaxID=118510 RepID=A0A6L2MNB5_TANCI|nr:hypothetical protein [Tanacetum cinerariifolium]
MIGKSNFIWKTVFEKLYDVSTSENAGNSTAPKSIATISHDKREELRKKGFKSLSMLFSLKYLSLASIKELNKNSSAPKRVHFVNSIVILSKDIDMEEDVSSTNACRRNLGKMMRGNEEVKEQGKEEDEIETNVKVKEIIEEEEESEFEIDEEVEEILKEEEEDEDDENSNLFQTIKKLSHHEWLLKNPRPPQDEGDRRGVRHLMRFKKEMIDDKEEVTYERYVLSVLLVTRWRLFLRRLAAPYLLRGLAALYLLRRLDAPYLLRGLAALYLLRRLDAPYLLRGLATPYLLRRHYP